MKWYRLQNGKWQERAHPPVPALRQNLDPSVEDPEGEKIEGKVLRRISWDEASNSAADVYIIPKAEKPLTWNDRLLQAKLESSDTFLHIWVYCPNLNSIPDEEPKQRIVRFGDAITAAARIKADLFIGPEYFFTRNTSKLDDPKPSVPHCYTPEERDLVERAVHGAGYNHGGMLIIPGTMLWKDSSKNVRNTALIHCRNFGLFLAHGKYHSHKDETYAKADGGTWNPGATHVDFEFRGFAARYQICADMGTDPQEMKDLHLLSGFGIGGGIVPRAHGGGWEVLSDGAVGSGRIEKTVPAGTLVPMNTPKQSESFSLVVHIRKLAQ